jgi:hypothetical protein
VTNLEKLREAIARAIEIAPFAHARADAALAAIYASGAKVVFRGGPAVQIEVVKGVEGHALYINDYRVAGPKPWGGGQTVHKWKVKGDDLWFDAAPAPTAADDEAPHV